MARTHNRVNRRRGRTGAVALTILLLGLAVVIGLAEHTRLVRNPRELMVGVTDSREPAMTRLLEAFAEAHPDLDIQVHALDEAGAELAGLLRTEQMDFILHAGQYRLQGATSPGSELSEWILPAIRFHAARVPATRFLHPLQEITGGEARDLLKGMPPDRAGAPDCFPLRLVPPGDLASYPGWDAIADLVLGSHPHSVQGFEIRDRGFVAYSLGNFIMDQRRPIQTESMILEIEFLPSGIRQIRVIPVLIEDFRPRILEGVAAEHALAKLRRISLPLTGE